MYGLILRLLEAGYTPESALNICYDYFHRRDYDGLVEFVERVEHGLHRDIEHLRV